MRQISINLYTIDELSESARSCAWLEWTETVGHFSMDLEYRETLAQFEELFDVDVYRWHVDENHYDFNFAVAREGSFFGWLRFTRWLWNNYAQAIQRPKYYGKLIYRDGERPRHIKRYSKATITYDCPLTGFCADYDIIDPVWKCLHYKARYSSYGQLIHDCLDSFFESWRGQMEYETSMEAFEEACACNAYEFTEYGEMWRD